MEGSILGKLNIQKILGLEINNSWTSLIEVKGELVVELEINL